MKRIILFIFTSVCVTLSFGQNQNISVGVVFDGEPYLSINPYNSQHMVVAWMGYVLLNKLKIKTRVTFDGGQTWSNVASLPHVVGSYTSADPSIEFDHLGNVYAAYIDFTGFLTTPLNGGVYVSKSEDGGLTWGNPVEVIGANSDPGKRPVDRPWISIDRTIGNNQGNIYISTMNAKGASPAYNPYFMVSKDAGNSFEPWRYLDTITWLAGSFIPQPMPTPCISSNGVFHAIYPSWVLSQNLFPQFIIASSADGGNSFEYNSVFETTSGLNDTLIKSGYLLRSDPVNWNHLAFFYLDNPFGDIDIFMRESYNAGNLWMDAIRINDDPVGNNRIQDLVWADFDNDGDLVVSWRDRRNATDSTYITESEIWGVTRLNDSTNFSDNFKLSSTIVDYDTILAESGNDFMCVKFVDDTINAVWGDTRTGKLNIWFQRTTSNGTIVFVKQISSEKNAVVDIFPNPANNEITISGDDITHIKILTTNGKHVLYRNNVLDRKKMELNLNDLAPGVYFICVSTKKNVVTRKVIKQSN